MLLISEKKGNPNENLYFTLKYVAGYGGRVNMEYKQPPVTAYSFSDVSTEAKRSIDGIIIRALPEVELWRERERIEAKLFGASRPCTPFF